MVKIKYKQVDLSSYGWPTLLMFLPKIATRISAWSRKIVGYHVDDTLRTDAVIKVYKNALKERTKTAQLLVHHSDRGLQYYSKQYQQLHEKHGVQCSMTDGYDCYQNALAERINGIIKNEYLIMKP
ncbi:IS3 family transposase, partial [Marinomonas piezotolerans]